MNCSQNNYSCTNQSGNLVYLTKVFFDGQENASPIMSPLTTTTTAFTQQLSIGSSVCNSCCEPCCFPQPRRGNGCVNTCQSSGCGCQSSCQSSGCMYDPCCICNICCGSCNDCSNITVTAATTFDVTKAYVITHSFDLSEATLPDDLAVTVDGNAITGISESVGQYIGDISGIMPEITKCSCGPACFDTCPGNFIMVSATGPWNLEATIVLEGTLYEGGSACQFRLCYSNADGTPISITGNSAFALCGVEIPCQINGISPSLQMDFDACASILNPALTAAANGVITLTGSLVVTPQLRLRVTRPSLFNLDAREINLPCDDLGQCSSCNPTESNCLSDEAACCCGHSTPNRVGEILNMITDNSCKSSCSYENSCGCQSSCGCRTACDPCGCQNSCDCRTACDPCGCQTACNPCDCQSSCDCRTACDPCDCQNSCGCQTACNPCDCRHDCQHEASCYQGDDCCGDSKAVCNSNTNAKNRSSAGITCQCCDTNGYSF